MKVSYCSSCKGRRWQLERTLLTNLKTLQDIDAEWIIYDYASPDDVSDALLEHPLVKLMMQQGKLKLFKHILDIPFSMALAKNLAHHYATGDFVFNLDIDNFISESYQQLIQLKEKEFLWAANYPSQNGVMGRIGLSRSTFNELGGYDLDLEGIGYDDINLVRRLEMMGFSCVAETHVKLPIQNTREQSALFTKETLTPFEHYERARLLHEQKIKKGARVNHTGSTLYKGLDLTLVTTNLTAQ